jgi:hypothetical protein
MRLWIAIAAIVAAFGLGAAAGLVGAPRPAPAVVPVPGPTVTETPEPVTPDACLEALDLADETLSKVGDVIGLVPATMTAVLEGNPAAMRRINRQLDKFNSWMDRSGDKYQRLRAECEG